MKELIYIVFLITFLSGSVNAQDNYASQNGELTLSGYTDFGEIHVLRSSSTGFVRATNSGSEPVTITEGHLTGAPEFLLTVEPQLPRTLQPNQFVLWNFRFFPQEAGERTAELSITSDATGSPHTITLRAEAVDTPLGPWEWQFIGRPLGTREVNSIFVDQEDDSLWYVTSQIGLFITRDGGNSWLQPLSGSFIHAQAFAIDPTNSNRVYAALSKDLYVSNDKGLSWTLLHSFPIANTVVSLTVGSDDGMIYVPYAIGSDGDDMNPGIFLSNDFGITWNFYSFGIVENNIIPWDIVQDPVSSILYVATEIGDHPRPYDPPFFRSLDKGITWEDVSGILPWHGVKIQVDPANQDVYFLTEGAGLYKSSDEGLSWQYLSNFFWLELLFDETCANRLYGGAHTFGSGEGGAFVSNDAGLSLEQIGLSNLIVNSLALSSTGSKLFAASYGAGIFMTPVPSTPTAIEQVGIVVPQQYGLEQNYPNPFNPVTTITFDLPRSSNLALKVYDMLGREVAVLASGDYPPGRFKAIWDATGFPSGVYLYQLQAETYSETRRLLLLK